MKNRYIKLEQGIEAAKKFAQIGGWDSFEQLGKEADINAEFADKLYWETQDEYHTLPDGLILEHIDAMACTGGRFYLEEDIDANISKDGAIAYITEDEYRAHFC